jgi:nucleoside-diphosphate-sugar epimerase
MKVLLTGASGFVGRHLLKILVDRGYNVRVIVRSSRRPISTISEDKIEVVETDDLFEESIDKLIVLCSGCHTLIHAAWYAEPGKYLTSSINLSCLQGTVRLANAFAQIGGARFIGLGSCAEYRSSMQPLDAQSPLEPTTLYAACKISTFYTLNQFFSDLGVGFAWCRLFYLYGEGEDIRRLAPYVHHQLSSGQPALLSSGNQVRDFIDVSEAAKMIVDIAMSERQGAVNICSGQPMSVRQFAERIGDEYGRRDLLRFGMKPDNLFDPPLVLGKR